MSLFWKFHPDCAKQDVDTGGTKIINISTKQLVLFKMATFQGQWEGMVKGTQILCDAKP